MVDLGVENKKLEAKIRALREELGDELQVLEQEAAVFAQFDSKGDGQISLADFQLMAYECGADLTVLEDKALQESYEALRKKCGNKITLSEFQRWLRDSAPSEAVDDSMVGSAAGLVSAGVRAIADPQSLLLGMRLKSRSFIRMMRVLRGAVKGGAAGGTGSSRPDGQKRGIDIQVAVGDFKDAKSGVYLRARRDAAAAAAAAAAVAGKRMRCLAYGEVVLREGCDLDKASKIAQLLNMMVQRADINSAVGINTNAVKSVRVATRKFRGKQRRVLRASVASNMDPSEAFEAMTGFRMGGSASEEEAPEPFRMTLELELPFAMADFEGKSASAVKLSADMLQARLKFSANVDSSVLSQARNLAADTTVDTKRLGAALPGVDAATAKSKVQALLIGLGFFRGLKVKTSFASPEELLKRIPERATPPLDKVRAALGKALDQMKGNTLSAVSDLVGEKGLGLLQMLPPLIVQVYQGCKNLSEGLDGARIHIQYGDYVISMDIVGTK